MIAADTPARLPVAPLLALVAPSAHRGPQEPLNGPVALLADRIGVTRRTVNRWARSGLDPWRADEVAVAAGWHPWEVWGDAWHHAA